MDFVPTIYGLSYDPLIQTPEICNLSRQIGTPVVTRGVLDSYANILNINPTDKSDQQLADEIKRGGPCQWISSVVQWAANSDYAQYLNRYVTDEMMTALERSAFSQNTPNDLNLIRNVNNAIYQCPRTSQKFIVFRGVHGDPNQAISQGQIITYNTPKSGSFFLEGLLIGYVNDENPPCCFYEIFVPTNAIASYHPSEDQIIFPTGAQFYVMSGPFVRDYVVSTANDYPTPSTGSNIVPVTTYQVMYINAPDTPQIINNTSIVDAPDIQPTANNFYSFMSLSDAYLLCYYRNLPYPYGNNPYDILRQQDLINPEYINRIRSGSISLNNGVEIRLYLTLLGYNTKSHHNYSLDQMHSLLRLLNILPK